MEIFTTIISFVLLIGLIMSPIVILSRLNKRNVKYKFLTYLTLGIIFTTIIFFIFSWWGDISNQILLSHYGYNQDAFDVSERFSNISAENMERVKSLEISIMGIGWPAKAIATYLFYSPYLLLVYLIDYSLRRSKKRNTNLGIIQM